MDAELAEALALEEDARRAWSAELDRIEATLDVRDLGAQRRALADPGYQAKWRAYTEAAQRRHGVMDRLRLAAAEAPWPALVPVRDRLSEPGHA